MTDVTNPPPISASSLYQPAAEAAPTVCACGSCVECGIGRFIAPWWQSLPRPQQLRARDYALDYLRDETEGEREIDALYLDGQGDA